MGNAISHQWWLLPEDYVQRIKRGVSGEGRTLAAGMTLMLMTMQVLEDVDEGRPVGQDRIRPEAHWNSCLSEVVLSLFSLIDTGSLARLAVDHLLDLEQESGHERFDLGERVVVGHCLHEELHVVVLHSVADILEEESGQSEKTDRVTRPNTPDDG